MQEIEEAAWSVMSAGQERGTRHAFQNTGAILEAQGAFGPWRW